MALRTDSPERPVILFDGDCIFCCRQVSKLQRRMQRVELEYQSFREPGVLERFPGLTREACEAAMQLVDGDGRVYAGLDAFTRVLAMDRGAFWRFLYRLPVLRQISDAAYGLISRNRFALGGSASCANGHCEMPRARSQSAEAKDEPAPSAPSSAPKASPATGATKAR